jgi:GDP-4-dehydro-6-deoxy-D-mannose reductase
MTENRTLVTGSTGVIGRALVRSLSTRPHEVHTVSRGASKPPFAHQADLTIADDVFELLDEVRPSVIIHLAGGREQEVDRLYASNVLTTVNLLQAAARMDQVPEMIAAGSAAEYGELEGDVANESSRASPVTDYGRAKLASSLLAQVLARASAIRLCIIRPFNVVSPDLPPAVALGNIRQQLITQSGRTRVVRCGRLDIWRDFVPLAFVVEVLLRLLELDEWPAVLNICSGIPVKLGSILEAMGELLDVDIHAIPLPALVSVPAAQRVVGDATLLHELGLRCQPSPASIARLMIG